MTGTSVISQKHRILQNYTYNTMPTLKLTKPAPEFSETSRGISVSQTHFLFFRVYPHQFQHHGYFEVDQTCTRVQRNWSGHECFINTSCNLQNHSIMATLKLKLTKPASEFTETGRGISVSQTHLVIYRTTASWLLWSWPNLHQSSQRLVGH